MPFPGARPGQGDGRQALEAAVVRAVRRPRWAAPHALVRDRGRSGSAYPFIVGGKPLFSLPAFVPVWYEITVLSSCLTAFFGNWIFNGLPRPHHPAFDSKAFERVTDDKFFIMVEATDPKFDLAKTKALLPKSTGATLVEELEA